MTAGAWPSAAPARGRAQVDHYLPLIARVLAQSERRVLHGQAVPASDKLVSLFEPHADIIVKGTRPSQAPKSRRAGKPSAAATSAVIAVETIGPGPTSRRTSGRRWWRTTLCVQ